MLIKTILNRLEKPKSFVYESLSFSEETESIEVKIRPRTNSRPKCAGCHRSGPGYDTLPSREFEYVPFWGFPVFFVYSMRRVDCPCCGITVETVPWAKGKSQLTNRYKWFLADWAKRMSWTDVSNAFRTSWKTFSVAFKWQSNGDESMSI